MSVLATALAAWGCNNGSSQTNDAGNNSGGDAQADATLAPSAGTCDTPVDLNARGTRSGATLTFQGTTEGAANALHPNPGCAMTDSGEVVIRYHFAENVEAISVTTAGSAFDTVLYVRSTCSQPAVPADVMDLACNNDSYDHPPQSLLFVTHATGVDDVFIVVDGSADAMGMTSGTFTLTVAEVALGAAGAPCRADDGTTTTVRCDGTLRCSEGGGPDGTALCVPTVATNTACDEHGFTNTCIAGATCAIDPTPPDGATEMPVCSLPGTHAGAPCRAMEPRCTGDLVCGTGDAPICVRVLTEGTACDMTGASNQCATGLLCRAMGDAGDSTCQY